MQKNNLYVKDQKSYVQTSAYFFLQTTNTIGMVCNYINNSQLKQL